MGVVQFPFFPSLHFLSHCLKPDSVPSWQMGSLWLLAVLLAQTFRGDLSVMGYFTAHLPRVLLGRERQRPGERAEGREL